MKTLTPLPEYRALMMFDAPPAGCVTFLCQDRYSLPHIRPGEFVVVDTNDRTPREGEVYVIQWSNGRRCICQARRGEGMLGVQPEPRGFWNVGALRNPQGRAARERVLQEGLEEARRTGRMPDFMGWSEGPYGLDDGHLESKLVSCVIGLYAPRFEGPKRIVGGARG